MKYFDKKISESYFQIYLILDSKEKKELVNKIKTKILDDYKKNIKNQIYIYKNINRKSNTQMSFEMINKLQSNYNNLTIESHIFDSNKIEEEIYNELIYHVINHMDELRIAQVFNMENSMIGKIDDNNSLTIIYSFCYVSFDYDLKLPKRKGNAYLFTNQDIDMIQTELLIANHFYKLVEVDRSSEFSDILFSYVSENKIEEDKYMDISDVENQYNISRDKLIGLTEGKNIVLDNTGSLVVLLIKKINDKIVDDINDELVTKLNFEGATTVEELREKIKSLYSFVLNLNTNVISTLKNIASINEFSIDEYVIKCFSKQSDIKDLNIVNKQYMEEIKIGFITSHIFSKYSINIDEYYTYIQKEYELLYKIGRLKDEKNFDDYFNLKAPFYVLYDFFKKRNLVTERS